MNKSPLRESAGELLEPGPPRAWASDLSRALFNSAFRSVTDACGNVRLVGGRWEDGCGVLHSIKDGRKQIDVLGESQRIWMKFIPNDHPPLQTKKER